MSQLYIVLNDQKASSAFWVLTDGSIPDIANPFQIKMSLCFLNYDLQVLRGCLRLAVLIQPQFQAENPRLQMSCGTGAALSVSRAVLKCNSPKRNCANSHTSRAKSRAPAK